jgi:hypothetical protein
MSGTRRTMETVRRAYGGEDNAGTAVLAGRRDDKRPDDTNPSAFRVSLNALLRDRNDPAPCRFLEPRKGGKT